LVNTLKAYSQFRICTFLINTEIRTAADKYHTVHLFSEIGAQEKIWLVKFENNNVDFLGNYQ